MMLIFNGVWKGETMVGNGVVMGGSGVRWEIKNVLLYAIIEPYTKVQVYHASLL